MSHAVGTRREPGRGLGSGRGFGDQFGGGQLITEAPSGPTYYDVGLFAGNFRYRVTVRWNSGSTTQSDEGVMNIEVGTCEDPEQPRTMPRNSRIMKGEYTVAMPQTDHIVGRTAAWELTRITARCSAPPSVPALPSETESPSGDAPDAAQP